MSLLWFRAVHPIYEVGDPEESTNPDYHVTQYGDQHKVNPSHFGMPVHEGPLPSTSGQVTSTRVPTSHLKSSQNYVYKPHVENLAKVPQSEFESRQSDDPVRARQVGKHYVVTEGHHRAAAAVHRGDKDLLVGLES